MSIPNPPPESASSRRWHDELRRLYDPNDARPAAAGPGREAGTPAIHLADAQGRVRALVLELARPADWARLGEVWRGVQQDLGLPAPAIAITGSDGLALWFSLVEPVAVADGHGFLEDLCCRYLGDVKVGRLALWPRLAEGPEADAAQVDDGALLLPALPGERVADERWSAFVAADLAAMFADEPWVDLAPSPAGQAELLTRLRSIPAAAWAEALEALAPAQPPALPAPSAPTTPSAPSAGSAPTALTAHWSPSGPSGPSGPATAASAASCPAALPPGADDPAAAAARRFLLQVMNDDAIDLALRIQAARALLG